MLTPSCRARVTDADIRACLQALDRLPDPHATTVRAAMQSGGPDAVLAHPDFPLDLCWPGRAVLPVSWPFYAYAHVRSALAGNDIDDAPLADYLATVLVDWTPRARALRLTRETVGRFSTWAEAALTAATGAEQQALGNRALWTLGLFPESLDRRGGPGGGYYAQIGRSALRAAAGTLEAEIAGIADLLERGADLFDTLVAVLREVALSFGLRPPSTGEAVWSLGRL